MPDHRLITKAELARRLGWTTVRSFNRHRARLEAMDPPLPRPVPGEPREKWDLAAVLDYIALRSGFRAQAQAETGRQQRIAEDRRRMDARVEGLAAGLRG